MSSKDRLFVFKSADDVPGSVGDDVSTFVVQDEVPASAEDAFQDMHQAFVQFEPAHDSTVPVYPSLWLALATQQSTDKIRLIHVVLLGERLARRIEELQPSKVVWEESLPTRYALLLADICDSHDVTGVGPVPRLQRRSVIYFEILAGLSLFFVDQMIGLLVSLVKGLPSPTEVLVVPSVGRFESISPVLDERRFDYEVVISPLWAAFARSKTLRERFEGYSTMTFARFASVSAFRAQLSFLFRDGVGLVVTERWLDTELAELVEKRAGIRLERSVRYALDEEFDAALFRDFLYLFLAREAIDYHQPDKLIVGSMAPFGKAVMKAASEAGLRSYIVPHSMVTRDRIDPQYDAVSFVAGEYERAYLEQATHVKDASVFLPLGRPYYDRYADLDVSSYDPREGSLSLLILTTNTYDEIRHEYIDVIYEEIQHYPGDLTIVIKTHPNEDESLYHRKFASEESITVATEKLDDHFEWADLSINMTSNVGLESILNGTPNVSVNPWDPYIRNQPFQLDDSIPVFTEPAELGQFFADLNRDVLVDLYARQRQFIESGYRLDGNSARRIAEYFATSDVASPGATRGTHQTRSQ